ncbi:MULTISPECIES: hypothetical protein [Clostridium]|uniref:hypothetical protein n=1 Tax=Clostridium TaxID=1485 RepID=UPI000A5A7520|nr:MULTISPECIES: hypothetical protein [Clostridium]MCD2346655.1 hypothetical protein [Clostridium guangxiense]
MKKFIKELFSVENIKMSLLMSSLSNNPDPLVIRYLNEHKSLNNSVNKNSSDKKAA